MVFLADYYIMSFYDVQFFMLSFDIMLEKLTECIHMERKSILILPRLIF